MVSGSVRKELPAKFIQFERNGIDISKAPMLVYPTQHYQNGGINVNGEAKIKGLSLDHVVNFEKEL